MSKKDRVYIDKDGNLILCTLYIFLDFFEVEWKYGSWTMTPERLEKEVKMRGWERLE